MIIPTNFSTMVSGFFCGYENKTNGTSVKIHRHLLSEFGLHVCRDLKKLKPIEWVDVETLAKSKVGQSTSPESKH